MFSAEGGDRKKPFRVTALTGVVLLAPCKIRGRLPLLVIR
jgi:hypothetical protein